MSEYEVSSHPFDVERGIHFKFGRMFQDRDRQIAEFEGAVGAKLPADFLEMIGDWCEGGFDGNYRIFEQAGVEVNWDHLLAMKHFDVHDKPENDVLQILHDNSTIFYDERGLALLPFGRASVIGNNELRQSYLAFDLDDNGSVVCIVGEPFRPTSRPTSFVQLGEMARRVTIAGSGERRIRIANSFREMMIASRFIFYG